MVAWPSDFPPPAINSLSEAPADNAIKSSMDKGPPKKRRRTTANTYPLAFTLKLTADQIQTLKDFFDNDTFSGVETFDFNHPRSGDPVTAGFAERPTWNEQEGVIYNATISLDIYP